MASEGPRGPGCWSVLLHCWKLGQDQGTQTQHLKPRAGPGHQGQKKILSAFVKLTAWLPFEKHFERIPETGDKLSPGLALQVGSRQHFSPY